MIVTDYETDVWGVTSHYRTPVGSVAMVIALHGDCFGYSARDTCLQT